MQQLPATHLSEMEARALDALRRSHQPLSAYAVLAELRAVRATAAAPTAYRALGRLIERGLAHRLESLNAYVACCVDEGCANPLFAICGRCGTVDERSDPRLATDLAAAAAKGGFVPEKSVIELIGHCAGCRD